MTIEERIAKSAGVLDTLMYFIGDGVYVDTKRLLPVLENMRGLLDGAGPAAIIPEKAAADTKVKPGEKFEFYGLEMVALDVDEEGITAITTEPVIDKEFDENNRSDWMKCSLRPWLNSDWLEGEGINTDDLARQTTAIVPDDTNKEVCCWGEAEDYVQLLTCEQYRKWRKYIPDMDVWWWTMTPFSVHPSFCNNVRYVYTSGALSSSYASGSLGVVPRLKIGRYSEAIKPIG